MRDNSNDNRSGRQLGAQSGQRPAAAAGGHGSSAPGGPRPNTPSGPRRYVPRSRMPVSERAKQFAPFAAINGLGEALKAAELEHSRIDRIEMTEDQAAKINEKLGSLYQGEQAEITYYSYGHYQTVSGTVELIDPHRQLIKVAGKEIHFKDLYAIE